MKVETKEKFIVLTAEDGQSLTTWKEGDDIKEFNASKLIYCPLSFDYSAYRDIDDKEVEKLNKEQEEAIKKQIQGYEG